MNDTPKIHPVDFYVGERLRMRRKKLNLSQSALGEMVGLSLQQVQKYEQGTNRIAASKLYEFAQAMRVPVGYFYEGIDKGSLDEADKEPSNTINFTRSKPLAILLIEDNPADEVLTRKVLGECPHDVNVFSVHDGTEALSFLRNRRKSKSFPRPDIILLDLNIPKSDGLTVLKEIKRDRDIQDIPVIILTNSIDFQEMLAAYKGFASGFVGKSFDVNDFKENMSALVEYWASTVVLPSMN